MSFASHPSKARPLSLSRLIFLLLASLLLLASSSVVGAQSIGAHRGDAAGTGGTRSIQGRLISPTGKLPQSRIRITLEHQDAGTRITFADDDGVFSFNGLAGGNYSLNVEGGKEFESVRESIYIEGAKPIYHVPIYLRLKPEANPAFAGVPKPAVELYDKGLEAARKGDMGKAVEHLNAALALHPKFAPALGELGVLYVRTGQLDKAVESFRSALKLMPDDAPTRLNYAIALLEKKEIAEAESQLRQSLKRNDSLAPAHMYLGVALMRSSKLDEAERELQRAVALGGDQMAQAHYYLGGIYWGRKDYKRAADELETYLKLKPKAPNAEQVRATIKDLRSKK
ncbi:MAG TPA: tetratricopeptide repeat protein [Pyrinomonadaceae bacterium]